MQVSESQRKSDSNCFGSLFAILIRRSVPAASAFYAGMVSAALIGESGPTEAIPQNYIFNYTTQVEFVLTEAGVLGVPISAALIGESGPTEATPQHIISWICLD